MKEKQLNDLLQEHRENLDDLKDETVRSFRQKLSRNHPDMNEYDLDEWSDRLEDDIAEQLERRFAELVRLVRSKYAQTHIN